MDLAGRDGGFYIREHDESRVRRVWRQRVDGAVAHDHPQRAVGGQVGEGTRYKIN